ncbi:hypothetical protein S245_063409 [Arachis hypogaea]
MMGFQFVSRTHHNCCCGNLIPILIILIAQQSNVNGSIHEYLKDPSSSSSLYHIGDCFRDVRDGDLVLLVCQFKCHQEQAHGDYGVGRKLDHDEKDSVAAFAAGCDDGI